MTFGAPLHDIQHYPQSGEKRKLIAVHRTGPDDRQERPTEITTMKTVYHAEIAGEYFGNDSSYSALRRRVIASGKHGIAVIWKIEESYGVQSAPIYVFEKVI
jgi:hypothetical protein